jgi:outer membrane protein TolC
MPNNTVLRSPRARVRAVAQAIALLSTLVTTAFSGCASTTALKDPAPPPMSSEEQRADHAKMDPSSRPGERPSGEARSEDSNVRPATAPPTATYPTGSLPPAIPPAVVEYAIDLTTALRLAEAENPRIAVVRQRIGEALAVQQGARALLLPSLNVGMNFHDHTGNLQRSSGQILNLNEKSLYVGGGAEAIAAGTVDVPAVNIFSPLTDAIFRPLAARQQVEAARFSATATTNQILMEVAERQFELLAAEANLRVRRATAVQEAEVARLTRAYADAKQGFEADAERASTELSLIQIEVRQAEEGVAVASARLAHLLHLDQSVRLSPIAPGVEIVTLVDPQSHVEDLIRTALQFRPEVGARGAEIAAAEIRHRQEIYRPLLPTLWLGFSGGAFGGGSNLVGPELAHFGGRTDFDVQVFWTLSNLGFGNLSLQKQRWAELGQAVGERSRAIAEIRSEVAAAHAEVAATRVQVEVTTRQLASAEEGFELDLKRIQNTVGRPIEVVNSLRLLNQARVDRIRAVLDYNKAQFRLFVALGSPPPLGAPPDAPIPPAPIASPPLPPLAGLTIPPDGPTRVPARAIAIERSSHN